MTSPRQMPDFLVLEAGEALDKMEALLRAPGGPAPDEWVRAARLLRGAAVMANQQPIAHAAAALEGVARTYRDRPTLWSAALRDQSTQAVEEFRALLRRVDTWSDPDTARALALGRMLELLAGRGPDPAAASKDDNAALAAGVRAFLAREGALVASALDRAARALRVSTTDREPLYTVIRRMQSLRGLAELGELAPLPEVLDGIEMAIGDLMRTFAPPPGVDQVMEAAAQALSRLSRDVAESGRPNTDSPETRHFTELLVRVFAVEPDVVPIESLYVDGDPEPVRQPAPAAGFSGPGALGPLELVSHGEHLARTADLLERSRSPTERDLRLYQLLGTLRSVTPVGPDPVAGALGVFARSVRETLAAGVADRTVAQLAACLRDAGELLRSVADSENRMPLSRRLLDVAHRLAQLGVTPIEAATPDLDVVPIEELLVQEPTAAGMEHEMPIVPIESLAPDDEPPPPNARTDHPGALETAFRTFSRLRRERPRELPSLAALVRPEADQTLGAPPPSGEPSDVPIGIAELCYRGRAALERADQIRAELTAALAEDSPLAAVRPLLDELLDLVPLALADH